MTNQIQVPNSKRKFDLEERTACFGEKIIDFARTVSSDVVNRSLINQLIRASTSIGANYLEADGAESKRDFNHKIAICKKEAKETTHWLRMLTYTLPDKQEELKKLWQEAHELVLIFSAITRRCKI